MPQESKQHIKVLIVAMVDSIHVARWLELFKDFNYDFTIISSSPNRRIHPRLKALLSGAPDGTATYWVHPFSRWLSLPAWTLDRIFKDRIRGWLVRRAVLRHRPDFVHAMELQNAGYASLAAFEQLGDSQRPPLLVTNYGSDIYWFARFANHRTRLKRLLEISTGYSAECVRDKSLAQALGLDAQVTRVFPNSGGLRADLLVSRTDLKKPRSLIAIKGYENQFGRALLALSAIEDVADEIRDYEIVIFSCNRKTILEARRLAKRANLNITCFRKNRLTHSEVLSIFRRSILYLGLSRSDGISTSMLEAMSQGAVPLQSGTACANEWIESGEAGFILDLEKPGEIAQALRFTLQNEQFRYKAQLTNLETIERNYLSDLVAAQCREFYQAALNAR